MAYLRWSNSNWYVYAHVDGGLWIGCGGEYKGRCYSVGEVVQMLSGRLPLSTIEGFSDEAILDERQRLLWAMREWVSEEVGGDEDIHRWKSGMRGWRKMIRQAEARHILSDKDAIEAAKES